MNEKVTIPSVVRLTSAERAAFLQKYTKSRVAEAQRILQEKVAAIRCCGSPCISSGVPGIKDPNELFTSIEVEGEPTEVPRVVAHCHSCEASYDPITKEKLP